MKKTLDKLLLGIFIPISLAFGNLNNYYFNNKAKPSTFYTGLKERQGYSTSQMPAPKIVTEYEIGIGILGDCNTYTREIRILDRQSEHEKEKTLLHELKHLLDPSLPEDEVRTQTGTYT